MSIEQSQIVLESEFLDYESFDNQFEINEFNDNFIDDFNDYRSWSIIRIRGGGENENDNDEEDGDEDSDEEAVIKMINK